MGALKVHHTATEDSAWDGPAAVAAMPSDDTVLEYCHAWQAGDAASTPHKEGDDDADDQKSNYKFPHHRKQGGPANIPGCNNGKSRLENSNIPAGDKPGVKSHLQAHIDDADKTGDASDVQPGQLTAMRFPGERSCDLTNLAGDRDWQRAVRLGNLADPDRVREHAVRAHRTSQRDDWFRIVDYTDGTPADIHLFDEIGFWGVSAADFQAQLSALNAPSITLHVNSPGGDVFDGIAILNLLRAWHGPVDVVVDGLAASAASFIAQAGDTVTMMPNSQMMIHDAAGICMGNTTEMADMAGLLDKVSENIANVYATRSGKPAAEWRAAMKTETWYTADEAVAAGLADKVGALQHGAAPEQQSAPAEQATATARWNLSFYNHNGRGDAPGPQAPVPAQPSSPSPVEPAPVHTPAAPVIDPNVVRAAISGAFSNQKEARR